jgi:ABC-2 type transport system permease protein
MPIHDQGYRRYAGTRTPRGQAWSVIARAGVRAMLARRAFVALLLLAWAPFFVQAIGMYIKYAGPSLPGASLFEIKAETFRTYLDNWFQFLVVYLITVYAGAGLIANDRRANALQIYLSKPLSRVEYVLGKFAVLGTFLLFVTWVPALALLVVQIAFSGDFSFVLNNAYLFPAITLFAFLQMTVLTASMLALSSMSKSSRYVAILYTTLIFFAQAVYGVLRIVTRSTSVSWVSPYANLSQLGGVIFRLRPQYDTPWIVSLGVLVALVALSALILERRVRGVEVVA